VENSSQRIGGNLRHGQPGFDSAAGPWMAIASSIGGATTTGPGYFAEDGSSPGLKTIEVRDVVSLDEASQRWLRLRVTYTGTVEGL
jgi:hypothetical protein